MKISFVIAAYNEEGYIADCLESIEQLHDPCVHEIIVVDNGSTDATASIASRFRNVKVVQEKQKGLSFARQRGLIEATGTHYAALDADDRVTPVWLNTVKDHFTKDPDLACLTGPYHYYDLARWKQSILDMLLWGMVTLFRLMGRKLQLAHGGNAVYHIPHLRAIGGFNTNMPFYGEDVDTLTRISRQGKAVFDPHMEIFTSARRMNAEGFWKMLIIYRLNTIWEHMRHKPFVQGEEKDWR